jgi:hypothetical protein
MTARSGDALSHVDFQARWDIVFDGDQPPRISASIPLRLIVDNQGRDRSTRICIAAMSGHRRNESSDGSPSFEHYLHKSLLNV